MSSLPANSLLDPAVIARAEMLGLQARQIVEGYMAGEHQSPYRGVAIEFNQHREYAPGDDLRHLDWKVLGRTDRAFIKQYEQDTNFIAHILLDGSESMNYGSVPRGSGIPAATGTAVTKLDHAKTLAACLAYLILLQRDAVAVNIFDTALRSQIPRTDNRAAIHNILTTLAAFTATGRTNLPDTLHTLGAQLRRKGIVILISDCFDDEEKLLQSIQHLRFDGHEVILFHVLDPHELDFPFTGLIEFEGLEAVPKLVTRPREIRASYLKEFNAFTARLRDGCLRNNTHYVLVNTVQPIAETLGGYLAFRLHTHR
jgi:uncharacterized protein (DUF58 family)